MDREPNDEQAAALERLDEIAAEGQLTEADAEEIAAAIDARVANGLELGPE